MQTRKAKVSGRRFGRACAWLLAACASPLAGAIDPDVPLADLHVSEWTRLDGAPAQMLRANVLFRAVAVPAGRSSVRFVFRPFRGLFEDVGKRLRAKRG